jgi:predicted transcriptional regulator
MDILQFFFNYYTHFQFMVCELKIKLMYQFDKTLAELLHAEDKTPIISIKGSQPLVHAFHILLDKSITGLAVVDDNTGKILGNISASDIKGINSNNFFKLNEATDSLLQDSFFRVRFL